MIVAKRTHYRKALCHWRTFLPAAMAMLTRKARYKPEIHWAEKSWTHNVFRVYEMMFWRRSGIKAEMTSTIYRDEDGVQRVQYSCHSWESVFALAEQFAREWLSGFSFERVKIFVPALNIGGGVAFSGLPFMLAIALDTTTTGVRATTSPVTWSHTVTGSDPFIAIGGVGGASGTVTTGTVSYNSVSATKAVGQQATSAFSTCDASVNFLGNPSTGAHTVSVAYTFTGSFAALCGTATSYTGAQSTSAADATASTSATTSGDKTCVVNVVASNCWIYVLGNGVGSSQPTMTVDQTARGGLTTFSEGNQTGVFKSGDTNATVSTGNNTVGMTLGTSTQFIGIAVSAASFTPLVAAALTISVNDSVTVSENISTAIAAIVFDSVTVSEWVDVIRANTRDISVYEFIAVEYGQQDMAAWYKFNNNANDSIGSNNGTVNGNPVYDSAIYAPLPYSNTHALNFDGNGDYVRISRPVQDDFTISFWMKTSTAAATTDSTFSGKPLFWTDVASASSDYSIAYTKSAGGINRISFVTGNPDEHLHGTLEVADGNWHHVAVTRKKSTGVKQIWIDGVLDTSQTGTNLASLNANANLDMGGNTVDTTWYTGYLDEVKYFTSVLEPGAIRALAQQTANVKALLTSLTLVFDAITVSEGITMLLISERLVFDSVTVTESITMAFAWLVSDSVTITENIAREANNFILVFDTVTITENITMALATLVFDSVTVTENISRLAQNFISVSDSITVSENITTLATNFISVNDAITVSEGITMLAINFISVFDSVTVTESVTAVLASDNLTISVFDSVSVTEAISVLAQNFISVSDAVTVSESVSMLAQNFISVSDSITVSESVNATIVISISVFDAVTVAESIAITVSVSIFVFDTVTLSDVIVISSSGNFLSRLMLMDMG